MPVKSKTDYSKYIGYILFVVTLIGWGFSAGKFYTRLENLESQVESVNTKLEKQQELLLEQKEFNGSVLTYIELNERNND